MAATLETSEAKIDEFKNELASVCRRYGLCIAQDFNRDQFVIVGFSQSQLDALMDAKISGDYI